jgi:predicted MPP superfamily phosphohydrolase
VINALKYLGITLLILLGVLLAWGLVEPYTLDKQDEVANVPDLPDAWQGKRVVAIGDMQVGMWLNNEATMRRAVQTIIDEKPAVALLLGDFVYHDSNRHTQDIDTAVSIVARLPQADIPTYAVMGNHDYGMGQPSDPTDKGLAAGLERALENHGIPVLVNEAVPVRLGQDGNPLYVVGLGSHYADLDFPEQALANVPDRAARVVMMHHPDSFAKIAPSSAPLAIAGHTHGGQIAIPGLPNWSYRTFARSSEVHTDGWIEPSYGASGNALFVNVGLGMSGVPLRINVPPAVTFFTLQQGEVQR